MEYLKDLFAKVKDTLPKNLQVLIYVMLWSVGLTIVSFCIKTISLMWF